MFARVYFVKSTPVRAFTGPFQHFEDMLQRRYFADILKMCMKKFDAVKYFLTNLQGFELSQQTTASSKLWLIVQIFASFNTLQICTSVNLYAFQYAGGSK